MSRVTTALAVLVVLAGPAAAQVQIVQYQFSRAGPGGNGISISSLTATTVSPNVSASDVSFSGSVAQQGAFGADLLAVVPNSTSTTAALAVANNSYFQFTVTPNAGQAMNLTSLTFNAVFGDLPPAGFVLRSSADGYATNIDSQLVTANDYQNPAFYTEDLTAAAYQNLTDPISFRVYSFGLRPDRTAMFYDDLTLNGTFTPVPEPATLLAVAAVGLAVARRRRHPIGR